MFRGRSSSYRTVAVELRKLLLDPDAARSFGATGKAPTLFGLAFGRLDRMYVQSLALERNSATDGEYIDTGPPLHFDPADVLRRAQGDDHLVSLRDWLKECPVRDAKGAVRRTSRILQDIADKEGAHIIGNWGGKDWREQGGLALAPTNPKEMTMDEIAALRYGANWEQFVVAAGAGLLYARRKAQGQWEPMFDTSDLPPLGGPVGKSVVLQRRIS